MFFSSDQDSSRLACVLFLTCTCPDAILWSSLKSPCFVRYTVTEVENYVDALKVPETLSFLYSVQSFPWILNTLCHTVSFFFKRLPNYNLASLHDVCIYSCLQRIITFLSSMTLLL